jgi:hypothetical protein
MTNTAETIQNLNEFRKDVMTKMQNREVITFQVGAIDIEDEKMTLGGEVFSEAATKKLLSQLRVKNNFMELSKNMHSADWTVVKEKLKKATGGQIVHGRKVNDNGRTIIDDVYMAAPKTTGILEIDSLFGEVIDSIVGTGKDISLKSCSFLEDKDEVTVTLLEHDNPIDVFSNQSDIWKTGKRIVWNGMTFSVAPFFERLVCSNGNTAPQFGFKANISSNKFNIEKIRKTLEKEITLQSDTMDAYLIDSVNHLKHYNVSVREYLHFRNFFNEVDHAEILKKWFDDSYLNKAYGQIVQEMPDLWKVTADAGKNAYDFFNDLTYIASHPDEVQMTERERMTLQIKASDLLFKNNLDLELVAPKVKWK